MKDAAKIYGEALYELARSEELDGQLLPQLRGAAELLTGAPEYQYILSSPAISKAERTGLLDQAFSRQVHPYVLNFLKILCERGALHEFEGCVSAFTALYNQAHGIVEASVTTGVPLEEEQRTRLIDKLSAMTGKRIVLSEKVDPGVVGGVLLEMNGKRYDNTLRHRLEAIHAALTAEA